MQFNFQTTPDHQSGRFRTIFRNRTFAPHYIVQIAVGTDSQISGINVLREVKLAKIAGL